MAPTDLQPLNNESAIFGAVRWIEHVLLGTVATSVGVLALAAVGFAMLQGRLALRDGARVVIGCFILFGAPVIARTLAGVSDAAAERAAPQPIDSPTQPILPQPKPTNPDPYAGASVPFGR